MNLMQTQFVVVTLCLLCVKYLRHNSRFGLVALVFWWVMGTSKVLWPWDLCMYHQSKMFCHHKADHVWQCSVKVCEHEGNWTWGNHEREGWWWPLLAYPRTRIDDGWEIHQKMNGHRWWFGHDGHWYQAEQANHSTWQCWCWSVSNHLTSLPPTLKNSTSFLVLED